MKEHAGAYSIAGDEGFFEQHNDKYRKGGETILYQKKYLWPMAEVILHHRVEFPGPLGDQDQGEQRIQQTQAQDNHYADKQGWLVTIQGDDALTVIGAPYG